MNRTKPVCEWTTKGKGQDLMCFKGRRLETSDGNPGVIRGKVKFLVLL